MSSTDICGETLSTSGASDANPKLLLFLQLPPPVHGVTAVNQHLVRSARLRRSFVLNILEIRFASSASDVGRFSITKIAKTISTTIQLATHLSRRPDAIYFTVSPFGNTFLRDCVFIATMKMFRVPRIYHVHGVGFTSGGFMRRTLAKWALHGSHVIALSPLLAQDVSAVGRPESMHFVPNGIPNQVLPRRRRINEPPRILFFSNMKRDKGPLDLVAALVLLHERGVQFRATFAGADGGDGTIRQLESTLRRHGLTGKVRYVGPAFGAEKQRLLLSHDIFVLPTRRDAFPLVILEAMASALPVVATNEGAIPEVVEKGMTGFLVGKGDANELCERICELLVNHSTREKMGEAGRQRFLERFTLEHFEERLVATLEMITRRRATADPPHS